MNSPPLMDILNLQLHTKQYPKTHLKLVHSKQRKKPTSKWVWQAETQSYHEPSPSSCLVAQSCPTVTLWTVAYQAPLSIGFPRQVKRRTHKFELLHEEWWIWTPHLAPQLLRPAPERWAPKTSSFESQQGLHSWGARDRVIINWALFLECSQGLPSYPPEAHTEVL